MESRVARLVARSGLRVLSIIPSRLDPFLPANLDSRPKIFGIGFHKTGTTSLGRALRVFGYRVQKGFNFNRPGKRIAIPEPVTLEKVRDVAFRMVPRYGAFEDNPWPLLFRELDDAFPGSKFILTTRDADRWVRSASRYFGTKTNAMFELIYGRPSFCLVGNETFARERFERHNREVLAHFADREQDLLVWNLEADGRWEPLCSFLNEPVPRAAFPHGKNSAAGKPPAARAA
jgi:hypothetical protein